jgi:hypothetical protein
MAQHGRRKREEQEKQNARAKQVGPQAEEQLTPKNQKPGGSAIAASYR